ALKWDFFVRHSDRAGHVLYPRAGTLGGCTAHNAMILVCPHDEDWNGIAELTGDASWRADNMRGYFRRLENCRYRPLTQWLSRLGLNRSGHGWNGWLDAEVALPLEVFGDKRLTQTIVESAVEALRNRSDPQEVLIGLKEGGIDPNDQRRVPNGAQGLFCL